MKEDDQRYSDVAISAEEKFTSDSDVEQLSQKKEENHVDEDELQRKGQFKFNRQGKLGGDENLDIKELLKEIRNTKHSTPEKSETQKMLDSVNSKYYILINM